MTRIIKVMPKSSITRFNREESSRVGSWLNSSAMEITVTINSKTDRRIESFSGNTQGRHLRSRCS